MRPPLRSFTLKKTCTRSVRALNVVIGSSPCCVSDAGWLPSEPGGGWGMGGMGMFGGCCPPANKTAAHIVKSNRPLRTLDIEWSQELFASLFFQEVRCTEPKSPSIPSNEGFCRFDRERVRRLC